MKYQIPKKTHWGKRLFSCLVLIVMFWALGGCGSSPGVQVTESGWQAQRYGLFNNVWGSTIAPLQLDLLNNTWRSIVVNGYVTTDSAGQGKMRKDYPSNTCTVYVFQSSSAGVTQETISSCPRGSTSTNCTKTSTWLFNTCKIRAVTLPANITFRGTVVTVIEYRELETAVILTSDGVAEVTPTDQTEKYFEVNPGLAAYTVTGEFRQQAEAFFGFPPGVEVTFDQMIVPIEQMDQVRQIQSVNLILYSLQLPVIPLPEPFTLGLYWLTAQPEDFRVSEAITNFIDWEKMNAAFPNLPMPRVFDVHGEVLDLRAMPYNPDNGMMRLDEAGYGEPIQIYLAFDETIPGLADLAYAISTELMSYNRFAVTVQPFNPETAGDMFTELEAKNLPVLVLGGY